MKKTSTTPQIAAKRQNKTSASLKAGSLSELRSLQRQALKQAGTEPIPDHATGSGSDMPGNTYASSRPSRRRPHRFFPPAAKPVTAARQQTNDTSPHAPADFSPPAEPASASHPAPLPVTDTTLTEDDIALFRRVVQSVTPGPQTDRLVLKPMPPATPAQLQQRRQHAMGQPVASALKVSDQYASARLDRNDTVFLQAGHGPHLIKGLKKGQWPVQASLDLHGSNLDEARERMNRFIQSCRDHQIRCIRIVHGKGYGSKGGDPVLKETVRRWLSQLAVVQAYIESDEANGGAGAVLVLLSKP